MKYLLLYLVLVFSTQGAFSQKITVINLDDVRTDVMIIPDSTKQSLLKEFNGRQDNTLRKQWTARTYRLSDNRLLIEFYDKQAIIINDLSDFNKLKNIRFTKNYIDFLKKNISYKIEIPFKKGIEISVSAKRKTTLKSEMPDYFDFEVYELNNGQVLFITESKQQRTACIYENIKGLCSENDDILNQYYKGMETWSEKLIKGDPLLDYEQPYGHLVYPKDIPTLIKNHELSFIESKIYVDQFYSNLYKSSRGYYVLIDEIDQKNGAGDKMLILQVRIYEKLQDLRDAQAKYEKAKKSEWKSEHFYQKISDSYGKDFPLFTQKLIDSLPSILNFDQEQLTFDSIGMSIVDEAIYWNHPDHKTFDYWFPAVLAYYGQCYMNARKDGKWIVKKEKEGKVLVPHLVLSNNEDAFDIYDFYKDLFEWPVPIKEAGDWDGWRKNIRKKIKASK